MVGAEVDHIRREGERGKRLDGEIHDTGHVRDQGLAVETAVDHDRRGQVGEGTREGTRVGEEAVGAGADGALPARVGVVVEDQAAAECQVAGDHDQVTEPVLRGVRVGGRHPEIKDAEGASREDQVAVHRDRSDRVAGRDTSGDRDRAVGRTGRDRTHAGETLVGADRVAVGVGGNIEGSPRVGQTEVDVGRGVDRAACGQGQDAAAEVGRAGVGVGGSQRGGSASDLADRSRAGDHVGEGPVGREVEDQGAIVGHRARVRTERSGRAIGADLEHTGADVGRPNVGVGGRQDRRAASDLLE